MKKAVGTRTTTGDDGWQACITYDDGSELVIREGDEKPDLPQQASTDREQWVRGLASEIAVEVCKGNNIWNVQPEALANQSVAIARAIHNLTSSAVENRACEPTASAPVDAREGEGVNNPQPVPIDILTMRKRYEDALARIVNLERDRDSLIEIARGLGTLWLHRWR